MTLPFERSEHGRQNRALFYGVDRIVYCEGGREEQGVMQSFDGMFWRKVISSVRPGLKVKILPRGRKSNLVQLAKMVTSASHGNIIIAMDRDYDEIISKLMDKPGVVYTYGYSFENDAFNPDHLEDLFLSLSPVCDDSVDIVDLMSDLVEQFCKDTFWAQYADVCGCKIGQKVIDRKQAQKYLFGNSYGDLPKASKERLFHDVNRAKSMPNRKRVRGISLRYSMLPRLMVGHFYEAFCFKLMCYLHALYGNNSKFTKHSVRAAAIGGFAMFLILNKDAPISSYYHEVFQNL